MTRIFRTMFGVCLLLSLVGCGEGYKISGKVIRGDSMLLAFASADDPRFRQPGLPGAAIRVDRDPTTLGRRTVASGTSDGEGYFSIPLSEFGAGWMEEQWGLIATRHGYENVSAILGLPGSSSGQHLLIVMPEGVGHPVGADDDLWEQYKRYK